MEACVIYYTRKLFHIFFFPFLTLMSLMEILCYHSSLILLNSQNITLLKPTSQREKKKEERRETINKFKNSLPTPPKKKKSGIRGLFDSNKFPDKTAWQTIFGIVECERRRPP